MTGPNTKTFVVVMLLGAAASPAFSATMLPLTSTVVNTPAGCTSQPSPGAQCSENYQYAVNPGTVTAVTANPTTYNLGDTFNQSLSTSTLSDFGNSAYKQSGCMANTPGNCTNSNPFLTWNFQDDFEFTTPGSGPQVQGAVLSYSFANIGLNGVQARIVQVSSPTATNLVGGSVAGVLSVVDGWQSFTQQSGSLTLYTVTLNTKTLAANSTYFLEVRGEAASAASYTGSVTFTPVPLPAGLPLLLGGLGLLSGTSRKRPLTPTA